jgi:hypothetical protein
MGESCSREMDHPVPSHTPRAHEDETVTFVTYRAVPRALIASAPGSCKGEADAPLSV